MIKFLLLVSVLGILSLSPAHALEAVGYREIEVVDRTASERPFHATLWYPARAHGAPEIIGENAILYGVSAYRDAPPSGKAARPLALLSHGFNGSWRSLSWLAVELARNGYIVAVPNHPGTSIVNMNPVEAEKLWERPRDISRLIDTLLTEPVSVGRIDSSRIAAIGHSLGAWTVAALAGARFDADGFAAECRSHPDPFTCGLSRQLGISTRVGTENPLDADMRDRRIGAFVTLDIGMARGFTPDSLERIRKPFLIISAGTEMGGLPAQMESGYLMQYLPSNLVQHAEIIDAMHFSFTQLCKPEAEKILAQESPADVILCRDGGTIGRAAIHRQTVERILPFLAETIPAKTSD
ncbi:alpha/beta fold hydrolase [Phyllobacterium salinisoli]|uniref:Alpha/beta fold hydrolase n=1 Tax=Phyllobacterium salinisoli TaxID=1899321 RepID=A0A368JYH2_9HYPH|nr:alpha/beta fold hydrolase [Phyllobacterium salinisoli]RCS21495.1 alpha/beta fold hydrolase [Phyllobacterium salinisoli]